MTAAASNVLGGGANTDCHYMTNDAYFDLSGIVSFADGDASPGQEVHTAQLGSHSLHFNFCEAPIRTEDYCVDP